MSRRCYIELGDLSNLARGDAALSVSITTIIILPAIISGLLIVSFSILYFMETSKVPELSIGHTVLGVFVITSVPVIIGM